MQNYTVYSKDGCPYCVKIKEVMKLAELNHVVYNLGQDFDRDGFCSQFGEGATLPQVVLNGDNLGGCTDTVKYLKEKNIV